MPGMHPAIGILVILLTVLAMEGVAYAAHRWIMHGPGWFLHADHHYAHDRRWEWNDLYFVIFAAPSITLIVGAAGWGWPVWLWWAGIGIAVYGMIYAGFHDIIVHRRLPVRYLPRSAYMKRIIQAHRLHHAVETRDGTVSFGFLIAPDPADLKAELKRRDRAGVRAPAGR